MRLDQQVKCIALLVAFCGLTGASSGCSGTDGAPETTISRAIDERVELDPGDGISALADEPKPSGATRRPKDAKEARALKEEAKKAGKAVVFVFGSTTCIFCKKLLANLSPVAQRADVVVIYVEVDTDPTFADLAKTLKVESYPVTFVVPPTGGAKRFGGCVDEGFVEKLLPAAKADAGAADGAK